MHTRIKPFDVVIIGASLAGSAATIRLGQAGASVALLDKSDFPRTKACGEGFSAHGLEYLQALGVDTSSLIDDSTAFYGYRFVEPKAPYRACVASASSPRGWGVPRTSLDSSLLATARKQPHVELHLRHTVRSLRCAGDAWSITCDSASLSARYVFIAAGAASDTIAREYITTTAHPSARVGYTLHAELTSGELASFVTIIPISDGEIYVTRIGPQLINISLVGTSDFIQTHRGAERLQSVLIVSLGITYKLLSFGHGGSHFEARRHSRHPTLYLLGDAAESFDPACGLGMTHALHTGIMAADSVLARMKDDSATTASPEIYISQRSQYARGIRYFSRFVRVSMKLFRYAPGAFAFISGNAAGRLLATLERLTLSSRMARSIPSKIRDF
jgi:flavin-dependent dehydrogenase